MKLITSIIFVGTIAIAADKTPVKVGEADRSHLLEVKVAAAEDQIRYASAIIQMNDAKAKAEASQQDLATAVTEAGKKAGCEIDLATTQCKPPAPEKVEEKKPTVK